MSRRRIQSILVANRGEIAVRILRTAKELGYRAIAVYSEEDDDAIHLGEADAAYCIGPAESQKSYLHIDNLLRAANESKADAIHPGYGFLSENATFAQAVVGAGLVWIGPSPKIIEAMGDKVMARSKVAAEGVPTTCGTGALETVDEALKEVSSLLKTRKDFRFPLLIKASGGGGGKGMRIVRKMEELKENLERARSESLKAFNSSRIFVERYLERPRHIEVQVVGDGKNVVHLFERECSLQRRHQKVIEEAPSPSISEDIRKKICEAAVKAARSVDYESVGTVEFIVSEDDEFYFLEMNTRIQVEHPVTEWITGVDLVRTQIEIAEGRKISNEMMNPQRKGHSIEVRLYAEDPDNQFLPQPDFLHRIDFPFMTGVRVDTSVRSETRISSYYDPMIAKISAWAPDREQCRQRMISFLERTRIEGLVTNRVFLLEILGSEFFKQGQYHTQLLDTASWREKVKIPDRVLAALCLKDHWGSRLQFEERNLTPWQQETYALDA